MHLKIKGHHVRTSVTGHLECRQWDVRTDENLRVLRFSQRCNCALRTSEMCRAASLGKLLPTFRRKM